MRKNRVGERFGKLLIVNYTFSENRADGRGSFARCVCICDCGNSTISRVNNLVNGTKKSCGCLQKQVPQKQPKFPPTIGGLRRTYRGYKFGAEQRNKVFDLTLEQFKVLTQQNCTYCGQLPDTLMTTGSKFSEYVYNGIDRVDNNIGYILSNCVTCCEYCNKAKGTKTHSQFILWLDNLVLFRKVS